MSQPGERPVELVDLQGAWRRDGRTIADGPAEEVADVLWLQVGRHFCDLRSPRPRSSSGHLLDQPQAFSGTVSVAGGDISFHHDLDSLPRDPAHPDQGTVHRREDVMFERGPGFEERWIMATLPGDDVGLAELYSLSGDRSELLARLIRIGPLVLAVWGGRSAGGAQFNRRHEWSRERPLNTCADTWRLDQAALALGTGDPLPEGWVAVAMEEV
ncbi:MAG TPA: hypothetical protein VG298_03285 [Acidimicrobiales bacterium]|jgi:hypothetical protein|nr:hypothetical protein [Acidimicrobiales bacterium]